MVFDRVQRGELSEQRFKADMDKFLEKDRDRAVFDLPPRSITQRPAPAEPKS